jgi:hypothetical protein
MDFLLFLQAFNVINFLNAIMPKGIGEVIILIWTVAGAVFLFRLIQIQKNCGNLINIMVKSKKTGIPMAFKYTGLSLIEPVLMQVKKDEPDQLHYNDKTYTIPSKKIELDTFKGTGIRLGFLHPSKGTILSFYGLVKATDDINPDFNSIPKAAAVTNKINQLSTLKNAMPDDLTNKCAMIIFALAALGLVLIGGYFIINAIGPTRIELIQSAATTAANATSQAIRM